jgi:pimeloyl-ACP methyl ester carboxylesterase/DNA-binding XRE family transcriptional regulator
MAHTRRAAVPRDPSDPRPYWSQALRALREARGITQAGWAMQLGYGRSTIKRWETGEAVPTAAAEAALIALCREKDLFRDIAWGPLAGVSATPTWLSDLLTRARLDGGHVQLPPRHTVAPPIVQYALSGEVAIAYQVFGTGPIDLVVTPGFISHRELDWEHPGAVRFFERLAAVARVIVFDKRGTGMSDRVAVATLDERIDDIRAVMDAAGSERAALLGLSEGGPMATLFAATYPVRTTALVLYGAFARMLRAADYPFGPPTEVRHQQSDDLRRSWGTPDPGFLERYGPSVAADPRQRAWWARYLRLSASPGAVAALAQMNLQIDIRPVLPAVRVPALVLHRTDDRAVEIARGRHVAESIPGAQFVELPGVDHLAWLGDVDSITDAMAAFLTGMPTTDDAMDTVLTTVLYTALVDPREPDAATTGAQPHRLWTSYDTAVRREVARYRGRAIGGRGAGMLATFDGPTRAIRCACAIRDAAQSLGFTTRAGVHTGETMVCGDAVSGRAVEIGAAVAALAEPGEVLVSGTVTDLVAGSGLQFVERDTPSHMVILGHGRLFAVQG